MATVPVLRAIFPYNKNYVIVTVMGHSWEKGPSPHFCPLSRSQALGHLRAWGHFNSQVFSNNLQKWG